ncbi:hypothetical protein OG892_39780 [Streptomyces sp. NBC_00341]|uniref:helix-turn-helix domain-containing protein n=1 Tax=Streptomyces sp. NBC_00341 TaxID=2975717 RepID=UPI003084D215|nr:hypothetical protein OG892_39780 [Streptomyces sp. NBC_00341]
MDDSRAEDAPSALYAVALREVISAFTAGGGTQKAIALAVHVSPAALSRYLNGERVAPPEFLEGLQSFLAGQSHPLDAQTYARLEDLCARAHSASGSPTVRLTQVRRELDRLREKQGRAQQVAETRLAGLEEQIGRLARELEEALDRVETQDNSLRHAQDYSHQIEAELAEQQEQTRLLQQEVSVLREQNLRLVEEQAQAVPGASTQDISVQAAPVHLERGTQDPFAALPFTRRADPPSARDRVPHEPAYQWRASPRSVPAPVPEPATTEEEPAGWRSFFIVAAMTYMSPVLWLMYLVALFADPGPSIAIMFLAAGVTLMGPHIGLVALMALCRLDEWRAVPLCKALFAAQIVTFIAWFTLPMGPVFGALGMSAFADWLATSVLM